MGRPLWYSGGCLTLAFFAFLLGHDQAPWHAYVPRWLASVAAEDVMPLLEEKPENFDSFFEWRQPVATSEKKTNRFSPFTRKKTSLKIFGDVEWKDADIIGNLTIAGSAFLRDSSFQGHTIIEGAFDAQDSTLGAIEITGPGKIESVKINGPLKIGSDLFARSSSFRGPLVLSGTKNVFVACKIEGNIFFSIPQASLAKKIYLLDQTVVEGNIIFQQAHPDNEVIIVGKKSKIYGEIQGGVLVCR